MLKGAQVSESNLIDALKIDAPETAASGALTRGFRAATRNDGSTACYQQRSWNYWRKALSEAERRKFRQLLAGIGYDAGNEELMVNETQALLMHTPDERAFGPANLGLNAAQFANLKLRWEKNPVPR